MGVSVLFNRQSDSLLRINDNRVKGTINEYIPLPSQFDIDDYKMMADFIEQLPSGKAQESLTKAVQGRGAFRCFRELLVFL
ncbi:hypothetical protein ACFSN5_07665 [Streptococcus tangpeifui]|uniref:hypothetical protein n=1 Tax=Streptococcus tangpeifui TaxID=2709400 RepID=UPI0032EA947B